MRNLTKLSLAQNHLTGSIPVGLGQLEHLQELNLAHNKLTGQIPKDSQGCGVKIVVLQVLGWLMEIKDAAS